MAPEPHPSFSAPSLARGFTLGPWEVHPERNLLSRGGEQHRIHGKFMEVLQCLAAGDGLVSRQELFDQVWPDTVVVEECLTRAVSELRKVLGDHPRRPCFIETVPKKGYRLLVAPAPIDPPRVAASPAPRAVGVSRWGFRPLLAAAAAAVPVLLVLALVLGATEPPHPVAPEIAPLTSLPGREVFPALSPAGDRLAFVWDGGDSGERSAIYIQAVAEGELPHRLFNDDGRYAYPAWSHDATRLAYVRIVADRSSICSRSVAGDSEWVLVSGDDGRVPLMPEYSPDGRWLAFAAAGSAGAPHAIHVMELASGRTRRLSDPGAAPAADLRPRFSPDGKRLAYLCSRVSGYSIAVAALDGSEKSVLEVGERELIDLAWDPGDAEGILFSSSDGLWRVSSRGGKPLLVSAGRGHVGSLAVARSGGLLAYVDAVENRDIWSVRLAGAGEASQAQKIVASSGRNARPVWSHDGRQIAFVSDRSGESQLWVSDADGGGLHRLTVETPLRASSPAWSPDDLRVAFVAMRDGQAKVCTVDVASHRITVLTEDGAHETAPSWSLDGRQLYVSRQQGKGWVIARRPVDGGPAARLSSGPGYGAIELPAGGAVVYARLSDGTAELWRHRLSDGEESLLYTAPGDHLVSWSLRAGGLYLCFRSPSARDRFSIARRAYDSDEVHPLLQITSRSVPAFDISADETQVAFDRADYADSDVIGLRWPT